MNEIEIDASERNTFDWDAFVVFNPQHMMLMLCVHCVFLFLSQNEMISCAAVAVDTLNYKNIISKIPYGKKRRQQDERNKNQTEL